MPNICYDTDKMVVLFYSWQTILWASQQIFYHSYFVRAFYSNPLVSCKTKLSLSITLITKNFTQKSWIRTFFKKWKNIALANGTLCNRIWSIDFGKSSYLVIEIARLFCSRQHHAFWVEARSTMAGIANFCPKIMKPFSFY